MNNLPHYRAWRFVYPGLDPSEIAPGLHFSASGGVDTVQYNDSVRQALLLLLSTRPGERVMRPDYGCDIHRLLFSPNDDTTAGLAIYYVQQAIDRWEPRIDVLRLDAGRAQTSPLAYDPSLDQAADALGPEFLVITLHYRVRVTRFVEMLTFSLNLAEGG